MRLTYLAASLLTALAASLVLACGEDSSGSSDDVVLSRDRQIDQATYPPGKVRAKPAADGVQVEWVVGDASCSVGSRTGVRFFIVYRRPADGDDWVELSRPSPSVDCPRSYQFVDTDAESGQTLVYAVSVVAEVLTDRGLEEGQESAMTESEPVTIP